MKSKILISVFLFFALMASAQEKDVAQLLRKDLQAEKAKLITDAMEFTTEESAIFWPVYRDYEKSLDVIMDKRLALIQDYANNYEKMSGGKATDLVNKSFSLEIERTKLLKKYFKKFSKLLSPTRAARFVQVENQLLKLVDVQVAQSLPLVY